MTPFFESAESSDETKGRIVEKVSYRNFDDKWRLDALYRHVVG